jgi:Dimethlysulfonioproprionate lyase
MADSSLGAGISPTSCYVSGCHPTARLTKMTSLRSPDFQSFLSLAEAAARHASSADDPVRVAIERIFAALQTSSGEAGETGAAQLPVCHHLSMALENVRSQQGALGALANAFAVIEPQLHWKIRAGAETQGESFLNGHANATIVGPEGLEIRRDVWIGVSLMAPHTLYPDHRHPPEEIYVALSDGQWRQASGPWHEPGIGGLVYNPPNVMHAMRSTERPLLALWFLWTGQIRS